MKPYGMIQIEIAKRIGVSRKHISEIVNGRKGISTDAHRPTQTISRKKSQNVKRLITAPVK